MRVTISWVRLPNSYELNYNQIWELLQCTTNKDFEMKNNLICVMSIKSLFLFHSLWTEIYVMKEVLNGYEEIHLFFLNTSYWKVKIFKRHADQKILQIGIGSIEKLRLALSAAKVWVCFKFDLYQTVIGPR